MIDRDHVDSSAEIEVLVRRLLKDSKGFGVFPTPVDRIIARADVSAERNLDLARIDPGFLQRSFEFLAHLKSALKKVLGLAEIPGRKIYWDHSMANGRKNFVKLHETGHQILPWQRGVLGRADDEFTLDPFTKELFEREASFFASSCLFQLEVFAEQAVKLPLSIKTPIHLANRFGSSIHAALRRYVQTSQKRCALLVLHRPKSGAALEVTIRNHFQSDAFTKEFGELKWPAALTLVEYPFVADVFSQRKLRENGDIGLILPSDEAIIMNYHYFSNSHNYFILITPQGEVNQSKRVFLPRG